MPHFKIRRRQQPQKKTTVDPPTRVFTEDDDDAERPAPSIQKPPERQPEMVHQAPEMDKKVRFSANSEAQLDAEIQNMMMESSDEEPMPLPQTRPAPMHIRRPPRRNPHDYFQPSRDLLMQVPQRRRRKDNKGFRQKTLFGERPDMLTQEQRNRILDAAIFG